MLTQELEQASRAGAVKALWDWKRQRTSNISVLGDFYGEDRSGRRGEQVAFRLTEAWLTGYTHMVLILRGEAIVQLWNASMQAR